MTTIYPEAAACGVCGATHTYHVVGSTSSYGAPDLDLRPNGVARGILSHEVQTCPSCGYCATVVTTASDEMKALVRADEYRRILNDGKRNLLTVRFLAASFLAEKVGDIELAAQMAVYAAWAADDEHERGTAIECRLRAVSLLDRVPSDRSGNREALTTDLLRRAGDLEGARERCRQGLEVAHGGMVRQVLKLQARLIDARDTGVHQLDEAR